MAFAPHSLPEYSPVVTPDSDFSRYPTLLDSIKTELDDRVKSGQTVDHVLAVVIINDTQCKLSIFYNADKSPFTTDSPLTTYREVLKLLGASAEDADDVEDDIDAMYSMLVTVAATRWNLNSEDELPEYNKVVDAQVAIISDGILNCFPHTKVLGAVFHPEEIDGVRTPVLKELVEISQFGKMVKPHDYK